MAVTFEGGAAVGTITLDKPPANSYDFDFMEEMGAAVDAAAADDAVKVVIVRSASKRFFCAGADIKAFLANDTAGNMKMISRGHEALAAIARVPKVFIAQIEGHALGGGLEITLACDLRFGSRGTYKLGVPEVTLGLLPGNGGTQRLPRIIGRGPALDLLLTGRQVTPDEAHRLGIVGGLFADEDAFIAQVEKLAAGPPLAVANIKRAVYQGLDVPLGEGLTLERELVEQLFRSQDANEGLTAFSEKRAPMFVGA
jgi:enoyl-CoA hydratase/carnithine racemase